MKNRFESRIQKILADYSLEQYREYRPPKERTATQSLKRSFVEFWAVAVVQPATTEVKLKDLNKIAKLLGTKNVTITGGSEGADDMTGITRVLFTAYGVKFPRNRRVNE